MASSFDRWEKDPFFNAAEEVQESADRMESTYRTWIHATKDSSSMWNPNELRRDLLTTLGTAKWQLEEFEREVKSSYNRNVGDGARRTRHQDFITAIDEKIKKVEHSLNESSPSDGKESKPWLCLDEEEKDELAFFLSGMPLTAESNNPKLCDKNSVSPGVGEEKEEKEEKEDVSHGLRRTASASADISCLKISVSNDPQQLSSSSGSSGANVMHKVPSLSGFFSSVESISKLKWPKNGYGHRKLKTVENHKETDNAQIPMAELNRGNNAYYERNKSSHDSSDEWYDKQLYGWCGAIQRQLQRSQYQIQYSRLARVTVSIFFLLCLIVLITFHTM